ncbi:MAG TPA: MBL fold metallo-hydrolase [Chloroflexota bacterium]|nr:MBL fold metallo-hydrolase [Chloroflexota bacterium]
MAALKAVVYSEDNFSIVKVGPMGPYGNNAYLLHDADAKDALLVDMPLDEQPLLEAIAEIGNVHQIVATHWHHDHWMTYDPVRKATKAPVLVGDKEINIPAERIDKRIAHGDDIKVGSKRVTILHTPGHTVGSICLKIGTALISGDTLFQGGPGRTSAAGDLGIIVNSIVTYLLPLAEETVVMPGHGPNTTIGDTKREYAEYQKHPWPADYHGDVAWLKEPPAR